MSRPPSNFQAKRKQKAEDKEILEDLEIEMEYELPQVDLKVDGNEVKVTRLVLTPEIVAVALYEARGYASVAARKLGTTVRIVNKYVRDYEICATAKEEAEHMLLDFAEAKLWQKVKAGDIASIIFVLRTKGKERGYTEKDPAKSVVDQQEKEAAQREAIEREGELMERLSLVGDRIRGALNMEQSVDVMPTDESDDEPEREPGGSAGEDFPPS